LYNNVQLLQVSNTQATTVLQAFLYELTVLLGKD